MHRRQPTRQQKFLCTALAVRHDWQFSKFLPISACSTARRRPLDFASEALRIWRAALPPGHEDIADAEELVRKLELANKARAWLLNETARLQQAYAMQQLEIPHTQGDTKLQH
jgi:hypothetical protein